MSVSPMKRSSTQPGVVKFGDIDPRKLELNGDRYLVELEEVDNIHEFGEGLEIELPQDAVGEKAVGWVPGIIIATGGEDIMYRPTPESVGRVRRCAHRLDRNEWVPMFWNVGDRVIVNRYAGHEVRFQGKRYRIVNQVDIEGKSPL